MPPEVVIFDIDGTLLDTREFILASFEHALSNTGLPVPSRAMLVHQIGRPLEDIYRDLAGDDYAPLLTKLHRDFQSTHLELSTPFPGVSEVLDRVAAAGILMCAVTSRSGRTSVLTLELAGIDHHFGAVISAEDTPAPKPDPAPLRLALDRIGAAGRRAAMVGDTEHDVRAGQAIGALTVAALYGFGTEAALAAGPDRTIAGISELPAAIGLDG